MPAPLAKGLIIAASVLVAAGLALYESPQVRQWVDQSRRKIAVALHNLGDEIQPRSPQSSTSRSRSRSPDRDGVDERRRRHEETIRRSRAELIKKAREEGVAVDLDELARLGTELHELQHPTRPRPRSNTADANRSFDDLVGNDGMLKTQAEKRQGIVLATGTSRSGQDQLRYRGRGSESEGSQQANPFADDESQVDQQLIGVHDDDASLNKISRDTTATLAGEETVIYAHPDQAPPLIDLSASSPLVEGTQTTSIHSLPSKALSEHMAASASADLGQSFHSFQSSAPPSPARSRSNTLQLFTPGDATPTDDGFSTNASVVGSQADDVARLSLSLHSLQDHDDDDDDDDAMSEAFSEIGAGQSTPGSWTDVGSDDGSET